MPHYDIEACLELVNRSPAAVRDQDKDAWLELFSSQAVVEDPVGSRPIHNDEGNPDGPLARFYDTFICGNEILFGVERDFVERGAVLRDLTMTITMAPKVKIAVPMHLLYELVEQGGELKIQRLAAHWELVPMYRQLMSLGFASLGVSLGNCIKILRNLGVVGMLGFIRARKSIGEVGKKSLKQNIAEGLVNSVPPDAVITRQLSAGYVSSASVRFENGGRIVHAVVLADFHETSGQLLSTRAFIGAVAKA